MSTESNTLYVVGVPEGVSQAQFTTTISGAAKDVTKVNLNERKRFAHVVFGSHESAEKGLKVLKKTPVNGTVLEFEWSVNKNAVEFDEASNKTVFIGNLATSTDLEEVKSAFAEHGQIERAFIITDKKTKASRGQAVVEYKERDSAEKALSKLNDTELGGQTITVEFAKAPRAPKNRGGRPQNGGSKSTSSKKPGQKRKADDNDNDNGGEDDGEDNEEKPAKKQKAAKEATPKKETPKKEAPKKEATPKKETPKKEAASPKKEAVSPKKETPKKAATPKKDAATPSKAKGKK